jgi:hypothetical protein
MFAKKKIGCFVLRSFRILPIMNNPKCFARKGVNECPQKMRAARRASLATPVSPKAHVQVKGRIDMKGNNSTTV